jgi:hypothetical protein
MRGPGFATRCLVFLTLICISGEAYSRGLIVDWQGEYNRLKAKIEKEEGQPQSGGSASKNIDDYIRWMEIKASDRTRAAGLAAQAETAENPYWAKMFTDLQELAQESGDTTLWKGIFIFMKVKSDKGRGLPPDTWYNAVYKAGPTVGQRLYVAAQQYLFDVEMVRDAAACLMRWANRDMEFGYTGLYLGRDYYWGDLDAEGYLVIPNENFNIECELRERNHVYDEGEPLRNADKGMAICEEIRKTCDFYGLLAERRDTTHLMEQYLKDKRVLCEMPSDKGHSFFKKLAEDYDLPEAKEYIEGFYARLKGKVEVEEEGKRQPASGAIVKVTDSKDNRTWQATAGADGKYEIKEIILHKNCSPFNIKAEYEEYTEEDTYDGPLEEPNKEMEYEKNLLIVPAGWEGTIEYRWAAQSGKDESIATSLLLPGGEYQSTKNWRLWVKLKKDRGNENVEVFVLTSARLELFEQKLDATLMDLRKRDQNLKVQTHDDATFRLRPLSSNECSLELAINRKHNTYLLSLDLHVKNIPLTSQSQINAVNAPTDQRITDSGQGTTEINESLELGGSLAAEAPDNVRGIKDLMQELGTEAKKFIEDIGGKQTSLITCDLIKSKKK